ncbi:hypothetical protein [Peterkaempfera bronchialis]|uniref:hypothetical protein n=1 Tax=Peterkaempfera bronchialis TaxID=2126346 RepID=UPI001589F31B|nr:hypothetical protein [Peterkaempfera bronchialis]
MTDDRAPATPSDEPRPEPVRFFGTSWVAHGSGYLVRRVAVAAGALLAVAAGVLVMWLAVSGVMISGAGAFVNVLLVAAVLVCSCLAAARTWRILTAGRETLDGWMADDRALGPIRIVGWVGTLAAYFVRSLAEAPGEAAARARHRAALAAYERRRSARSGRPGAAKRRGRRG